MEVPEIARWEDLERDRPEIALNGTQLLYQHGAGLAYLATQRKDGGFRIHPFCPVVTAEGIYGLIGDSPKRDDLARGGSFAIHAFPKPDGDDEFMLAGRAVRRLTNEREIATVADAYHATGSTSSGDEWTFEFLIDRALLSPYEADEGGKQIWPSRYFTWQAK